MTASIPELLRAAIDERFAGNLSWCAETLGVPVQYVSRWIHVDQARRTMPSPGSCTKIAALLELDIDTVLELAGHRPPRPAAQVIAARRRAVHDQLERWLTAASPEHEALFWRSLKAHAETTLAMLRDLSQSAVSEAPYTAVNKPMPHI